MPVKENKVYIAVVDTNVIISALLSHYSDAATSLVLDYLFKGLIVPLYNEEILSEYSNVLHRAKFKFPEELISKVLRVVTDRGISSERILSDFNFPDPKDIVFYEVALSKENAYLVTGNTKHFPKVDFVVTPAEMIEIINS